MASRQINNHSRDVKRRIDQITKKCNELKSLGVAVGVAYSSAKTNGLYVLGDERITKVIEKYKDEILLDPEWMEEVEDAPQQPLVILPPLPGKVEQLNSITKKALRRILASAGVPLSQLGGQKGFLNITTPPEGYRGM